MKKATPFISVLVFLLVASCTTTKGSLFKQVLSSTSPPEGSSSVEVQPSDTNPEQVGLEVDTNPSDAQVYLNDVFIGDTPLLYSEFRAGTYKITISKRGYYDNVRWLNLDPTAYTLLQADLTPKTGYLLVSTDPTTATVTVDGEPEDQGIHQLAVGTHRVRVRAFGYEDARRTVDIGENQTVDLQVVLSKAAFRISALSPSREVLNPLNPGALGAVVFSFDVSTFGDGKLFVSDSSGRTVYQYDLGSFVQRKQSFEWNGRADDGSILPNGSYRVTVSGRGAEQPVSSSDSTTITLDQGAFIGLRSLVSGTSGLMFAGTPEVLPRSSYTVGFLALAHVEAAGALMPVQASLRAVPYPGLELDVQALAELVSTNSVPYSVSLSGKYLIIRPKAQDGLQAAVSVKGTYMSGTTSDTLTNFTGLSLGVPLEYRVGPLGVVLMPELIAAPYAPTYSATSPPLSLTSWAYGRAGLFLDFGSLVTGASIAVRTRPFTSGFGLAQVPLAGGWEIHWLLPHTQLVVSGGVAGEFSPGPAGGFYLMGGAGLGFVN